ncbi:hypothetical protein [Fodinibius salsisoli]|uniref:Uncharacterized protein n=1 Tax=Fodinibius salsisoli TaxID=2820877 RepID=A0ABT3PK23_9BACT|nr:hypothetical protein [Fodinibius salsisoli]MCW9706286.1 hypothetical protein [Fodinibius salsisoli]
MDRFKNGICFLIVLNAILAGIGTAILHPYVHVLKMKEQPVQQHGNILYQALPHVDAADSCYICTFSQKLTYNGVADLALELALIPTVPQTSPFFYFNYGYEAIIFLRAPPLV